MTPNCLDAAITDHATRAVLEGRIAELLAPYYETAIPASSIPSHMLRLFLLEHPEAVRFDAVELAQAIVERVAAMRTPIGVDLDGEARFSPTYSYMRRADTLREMAITVRALLEKPASTA